MPKEAVKPGGLEKAALLGAITRETMAQSSGVLVR